MISNLIVRGLVLASVSMLLAACGTTSQFHGYVSASAEDAKVVQQGGYSEAATAQIAVVQHPDYNGGKISLKAMKKIQQLSMSCQHQVDPQAASAGQSGVNGAVSYGVAGLGTGPAAAAAFAGASVRNYAIYGGGAYLLPGAVNGLVSGSYALASLKGTCTQEFWRLAIKREPELEGTVVLVVYAGKAWGNSMPPALDRRALPSPLSK